MKQRILLFPLIFPIMALILVPLSVDRGDGEVDLGFSSDGYDLKTTAFLTNTMGPEPTPTAKVPYKEIGDMYLNSKKPDLAAVYYIKALENDPEDLHLLNDLQAALNALNYDPRIEIADELFNQQRYEEAFVLYSKILEDNSSNLRSQQGAIKAAQITSGRFRLALLDVYQEGLPKLIVSTIELILNAVPWLFILGSIYLGAKLVQNIRTKKLYRDPNKLLEFVILPFDNAVTTEGTKGIEQAVRMQIADWLLKQKALVSLKNQEINVSQIELPDIETPITKLVNWFSSISRPMVVKRLVSATLVGKVLRIGAGGQKSYVGLMISIKDDRHDALNHMHTFWKETDANSENGQIIDDYLALAKSGAQWVFNPDVILNINEVERSYQANALLMQARAQENGGNNELADNILGRALEILREPPISRDEYDFSPAEVEEDLLYTYMNQPNMIEEQINLIETYKDSLKGRM